MKTDVIMTRKMGKFDVFQRISDGMFNATSLLQQHNQITKTKRDLDNFWKSTHLNELMSEIAKNEYSIESVDFTELKKMLSKSTRGKNGGTWMEPLLFLKFAQYLSPRFEYHVLKFVADQLIYNRHSAGDNYNGLTSSVQKFVGIDYRNMAKGLNWIVFNRHKNKIRDTATESQLLEMSDIQKNLAFSIDMGYIRSFDELLNEMRRMYHQKWDK